MLASTWSVLRLTVGTLLMLIGVLGTILPIIPGVPVFLAGLAVAGSSHPVTRFVRRRWDMWRAWRRPDGGHDRRRRRRRPARPGDATGSQDGTGCASGSRTDGGSALSGDEPA